MPLPENTDLLIFIVGFAAILLSIWIGDRLTKK